MAAQDKLPPPDASPPQQGDQEQPLIAHLLELRDRLLKIVVSVLVVFLALFFYANDLYTLLAEPLLRYLPKGSTMIAIDVASPFLTPVKLTLWVSIFIAVPIILYHLWAFVAPGLYKHERKMVYPLLVSSTLLFYGGAAFAYFVVFPLVFKFLTGIAPQGVAVMTDISKYLDFVLGMFFAFGAAFEVPIAVILLVWMGAVTPEGLAAKRRYVFVGAFVVGMLLTPPDIISQTLLAIPLWLLFEAGVLVSRLYVRKNEEIEDIETDNSPTARTFNPPTGTQPVAPSIYPPPLNSDTGGKKDL